MIALQAFVEAARRGYDASSPLLSALTPWRYLNITEAIQIFGYINIDFYHFLGYGIPILSRAMLLSSFSEAHILRTFVQGDFRLLRG